MKKNEDACPFCGSEEIRLKTPFTNGSGEEQYKYCCLAQKKNHDYMNRHNAPYIKGTREINIKDVEGM